MLDEGQRRARRGAIVRIGSMNTQNRAPIAELVAELQRHTGTNELRDFGDPLPVKTLLQELPNVVLVDELARPNPDGATNPYRWQDVQILLDHGIDVVTTLAIGEIESMSDVVSRITGKSPLGRVPDVFVCSTAQIELVDMSPQALRRRLAHGNVYPPELADAALSESFEESKLAALRQMTLLWVADRMKQTLQDFTKVGAHQDTPISYASVLGNSNDPEVGLTGFLGAPNDIREQVLVAVTGSPRCRIVIRRAARIALRSGADLLAVHVKPPHTHRNINQQYLAQNRTLVSDLGGSFHTVTSDDVPKALLEFARAKRATQIVVGTNTRMALSGILKPRLVSELIRQSKEADVHIVCDGFVGPEQEGAVVSARGSGEYFYRGRPILRSLRRTSASRQRELVTGAVSILGLGLLTLILHSVREHVSSASQLMLFLGVVVVATAAGGLSVGVVSMVTATLLLNWFFTAPYYSFSVRNSGDLVALFVFGVITLIVAYLVSQASAKALDATRARHDSEILARSSATAISSLDPTGELIEQLRIGLGLTYAYIEPAETARLTDDSHPNHPDNDLSIALDAKRTLRLGADQLSIDDHRLIAVFADQIRNGLRTQDLSTEAARAAQLSAANDFRTALLRTVSHDLRTPLAGIKAAATSLLSTDIAWSPNDQREFLETISGQSDHLNRLIEELLEMSRLESGVIRAQHLPTETAVVFAHALGAFDGVDRDRIDTVIGPDASALLSDPMLLERIIYNLVANALHATANVSRGARQRLTVEAQRFGDLFLIRVIDQGPGIAVAQRSTARLPFHRLGDLTQRDSMGLGLAIADGLTKTLGAQLRLDDTPGGGLTATLRIDQESNGSR